MLKSNEITLTAHIPRFEQLSMKRVWKKFKDNEELVQYMPSLKENGLPPRSYFYEILHSAFRRDFDDLIEEAKQERKEKLKKVNKIIYADTKIINEIHGLGVWIDITQSRMSKRVLTRKPKRKRDTDIKSYFNS